MTQKIHNFFFSKYLEDGEKIEAVFHRHPLVFIPEFARILFFGFGAPLFLWYLFSDFSLFFVIWIAVSCVRIARSFFIYFHDTLILTDVSLVDVYWHGFFDRSSARLEYPMIEGVNIEVRGFIRTIFNYGKITVTRQGNSGALSLNDAMNPSKIERKVMAYQEQFVTNQSLKDADALKTLLTTMVRHHNKSQGTVPASAQDSVSK